MKPCNIILPTGISFLILTAIAMTGCKTSEANYRAAYQTAKTASADGIDSTIYARIRQEAVPTAVLANGDSVRTQAEFTTIYSEPGDTVPSIIPYGVVVAQFKQIFNAKAMRQRLRQSGYPNACIVSTSEPLYYVVAESYDDINSAAKGLKKLSADNAVTTRPPFPWILRNPRVH